VAGSRWRKLTSRGPDGSEPLDPQAEKFRAMVLTERERVRELREQVRELRERVRGEQERVRALRTSVDELAPAASRFPGLDAMARTGAPLAQAMVDTVRATYGTDNREPVRAICHALMEDPAQTELGHLAFGVFLVHEELYVAAESCFAVAGPGAAKTYAPVEYFLARLAHDADAGEAELAEHFAAARDSLTHQQHLELLQALVKHLRVDALVAELPHLVAREEADPQLDAAGAELLRWFVARTALYRTPVAPLEPGTVSLAIMDYKLLDKSRTSANRGDYVQTLAAIANIARFSDVEFVGGSDLAAYLTELQGEIRPERRLPGIRAKVQPTPLDRDFASGREYPENTWLLCNGWFMKRNYWGGIDFPFPATVNPLFLSFHIDDPDLMDEEVAARLKPYEPIGCRDWNSVYRLADFGVKAFFTGCLTTTVSQVMPDGVAIDPERVAVVETDVSEDDLAGKRVDVVSQADTRIRDLGLVEAVQDAREMLAGYQPVSKVYTHRLHCYLPCRSMGLDVDFRPKNPSDVRFEGLLRLDADELHAMRTAIEDRLERVFSAIFSGGSRDEVMALWRELAEPDVAYADRYRSTYPEPPATSIDVRGVLAQIRPTALRRVSASGGVGEVTVAFAIDQNLKDQLAVVLQSIADATSSSVDVHIMGRGLGEAYLDRLSALLPQFSFTLYDFGLVDYGENLRMLRHITVSTMDRLFLPELLSDVDRVLYLDADILVQDDVAALYGLDLGGAVIAGKKSNLRLWRNAIRMVTRASLRLPPEEAWALRRRLHHRYTLQTPSFNAGVLLMDLRTMREERLTEDWLYLVEHCAFNDQDVLNVYADGRVLYLDSTWNHAPHQDRVESPRIIHWQGPVKPWGPLYVWGRPRYEAVLERVSRVPERASD
jgi:lipopolysaccharide biosynthesis glycosyltransferase